MLIRCWQGEKSEDEKSEENFLRNGDEGRATSRWVRYRSAGERGLALPKLGRRSIQESYNVFPELLEPTPISSLKTILPVQNGNEFII